MCWGNKSKSGQAFSPKVDSFLMTLWFRWKLQRVISAKGKACLKAFIGDNSKSSTSSDHLFISHLRNSLHKKGGQAAIWQNFLQRVTTEKYQLCPLFVNSAQILEGVASEKWKLLLNEAWWYKKCWHHWKANKVALLWGKNLQTLFAKLEHRNFLKTNAP